MFDFDGLIVDSEIPVFQAWSEIYAEHGQTLSLEFWKTIIGRGPSRFDALADLELRLGQAVDREGIDRRRRARVAELMQTMPVLPGVEAWIEAGRRQGLRLAVASSSSRAWVEDNLRRLRLRHHFSRLACRDDVAEPKPAPDVYLAATTGLGVAATEALALEDSDAGVKAAKAAGLYCLAVPSSLTQGHDLALADWRAASLAEQDLGEILKLAAEGVAP